MLSALYTSGRGYTKVSTAAAAEPKFFLLYCRKTVIPETSLQRVKTNLVRKVHSR